MARPARRLRPPPATVTETPVATAVYVPSTTYYYYPPYYRYYPYSYDSGWCLPGGIVFIRVFADLGAAAGAAADSMTVVFMVEVSTADGGGFHSGGGWRVPWRASLIFRPIFPK